MNISIQYLSRKSIEVRKWDQCIHAASNSLVYGYSWYLDAMTDHWDGLILNDYEVVMPLPWRKKYGIRYVYPPAFCQQLGVFGQQVHHTKYLDQFLNSARQHFPFMEMNLNFENNYPGTIPGTNFTLALDTRYENIFAEYKPTLQQDIAKAGKSGLQYFKTSNYRLILESYRHTYGHRFSHVTSEDFQKLTDLCSILDKKNKLIIREAGFENNKMAGALLFDLDNRLYLMASVTSPEGREYKATHFLINEVIREFTGLRKTFDFEGSGLPGVSRFYKSFGPINQPYFFFKHNGLPRPLRWFKN